MSLYEVAGDGRPTKAVENNYTIDVNNLAKGLKFGRPLAIKELAEHTKLPINILEIVSKYMHQASRPEHYTVKRNSGYSSKYVAVLPAGFVLDEADNAIKFFNELNKIGNLKMVDIHALEYSIFAFNDGKDHLTSLTKGVESFTRSRPDMYHMQFSYDYAGQKYAFGILLSLTMLKVGNLNYDHDKRQSLIEYWFPKYDEYFSKGKDKISEAVIKDFIEECRKKVKGAK